MNKILLAAFTFLVVSCNDSGEKTSNMKTTTTGDPAGSFGHDLNFLRKYHNDLVVMGDSGGAQVIIAPAYQGRVMTSTTEGEKGLSFGWINHELIASGKP